jgi:hypothetical protein
LAEAKLKQRADNDVEKRQAIKEGSKQASSRNEGIKLIEKMKEDCSLSRLEHGRSERHRVVSWKSL